MVSILIVDDDEDFAESLADLLELQGHSYCIAHDGSAAVELSKQANFDLTFLDVKMPGIDGVETLRRLRAEQQDMKIVVVTGYATADQLDDALAAGAFAVFEKPCPIDQMLELADKAKCEQVVLIADDDTDFSDLLDEVLSAPGRKVRIANSGPEALGLLEEIQINVLLLDLRMPEFDGYAVLRALQKRKSKVPVIVLTAYPYSDEDLKLFEDSVKVVLAKPVAPRRLIEAITSYGLSDTAARGRP